jgi:hypothetical protein
LQAAAPKRKWQNLRAFAVKVGGREQLAVEAFAEAVEEIPLTLAENAGLDNRASWSHYAPNMRNQRAKLSASTSHQARSLTCTKMVIEPLRVKLQVIKSATEATNMILKIDDLISIKGRQDARCPRRNGWYGRHGWNGRRHGRNALLSNPKLFLFGFINNLSDKVRALFVFRVLFSNENFSSRNQPISPLLRYVQCGLKIYFSLTSVCNNVFIESFSAFSSFWLVRKLMPDMISLNDSSSGRLTCVFKKPLLSSLY